MQKKRLHNYRWLLFGILAMMYILVYFYRVSLAVVAGDISRELHLTPQELGTLSGILFYVYAAAQLPLGPLIDKLGGRLIISSFGIITALGGLLFAQADTLQDAIIARMLIGIGTASTLMAAFSIFSHWYSKIEFGRVTSLMIAVGNLGNLSATAPLALAVAYFGWRDSFLVIGWAQLIITVIVLLLVRNRPPHPQSQQETVSSEQQQKIGVMEAWRRVYGLRDFWMLALLAFCWYGNYMAVQGLWGGPYLMNVAGLSREDTGNMLMLTSIGFITGSLVIDMIALKVFKSYQKTMLYGQLLLFLLMCSFLGIAERLPLPLLGLLFFTIGLAVSSGVMIYPIIRSMYPVQIVGTALTSLNFFVLMGAAVTQHAMGIAISVFSMNGTSQADAFHQSFMMPIAALLLAAIIFHFAKDYSDIGRHTS